MTANNKGLLQLLAVVVLLLVVANQCETAPSNGCYDTDPTQWTEMICPGDPGYRY